MRVYESQHYHTTHFSLPAPKLPSALLFPGNLPAYKLPSLWGITAYSSFSQPFSGFYYNEKRLSCQERFSGFHKFIWCHTYIFPALSNKILSIISFALFTERYPSSIFSLRTLHSEKRLSCQERFSGFHKFMPAIVYQVDKIILFADCYNNLITALQFIRLNS